MAYYNVRIDNDLSTAIYPKDIGWALATIPVITHSAKTRDRFSVPNRDGDLLGEDEWRGNAYITMSFHSRVYNDAFDRRGETYLDDSIGQRINRLYKLLKRARKLYIYSMTNEHEVWADDGYYEIKGYAITNETRIGKDYVRIEVQFEIYPYKFMIVSQDITSLTITNPHDDAMPLYTYLFENNNNATITVNGYAFVIHKPANISTVYIDVRLEETYTNENNVKSRVIVEGDYKRLHLPEESTTTITLSSGSLITKPRWGYKL